MSTESLLSSRFFSSEPASDQHQDKGVQAEQIRILPPGDYLVRHRNVKLVKILDRGRACPPTVTNYPIFPGICVGSTHGLVEVIALYRINTTVYIAVRRSGSRYLVVAG